MTINPNSPETPSELETVGIADLRVGDIVHTNGMRVYLDHAPVEYPSSHGTTRSFKGHIWNLDEITAEAEAGSSSASFILSQCWDYRWFDAHGWVRSGLPNWTIQGNDLTRWTRETVNVPVEH